MINIKYESSIKDKYYMAVTKCKEENTVIKSGKLKGTNFITYYNENIKNQIGDFELRDILFGDFEKIIEIKNELDNLTLNEELKQDIKELFNYDKGATDVFKPISKKQPDIKDFFEEYIQINTCFFCNIDFINAFEVSYETYKSGFTLDHFINKENYPLLGLSLFNLIPSCYICNTKLKGTLSPWKRDADLIKVSPSSDQFVFDEKVKFKTFLVNDSLSINENVDFEVILKEDFSDTYENYIEVFFLNERYSYHKYYILEMIKKRKIYPDSRIKEISNITNQSMEKVKQDLFGVSMYKDNLSKRSLTKFTRDIARELGLI